jgi:hypothetical protein
MIKNFATFSSTLSDDSVEDENGDIVIPAGRNVAAALCESIPHATLPVQHSFYGWSFDFRGHAGREASALLQHPGPWLLIIKAKGRLFERPSSAADASQEAVQLVGDALRSIASIADVQWMTEEEFESRSPSQ